MPEGLEAEIWRRSLDTIRGREITDVWVDDRVVDPGLAAMTLGEQIVGIRRHGKVVVIDTSGASIGLHFGMTGRLVVDDVAPIERLEYASGADREEWDRLRLRTGSDVTVAVRMNDPRRLGRISVDPDLSHLGPDVLSLTTDELRDRLAGRRASIKTLLLDQTIVAGLGNLCADEVLFWAGVAPGRPTDELSADDVDGVVSAARRCLVPMLALGGSTHGILDPSLRAGPGICPWDDRQMIRSRIGGRTAVWCPAHQF